jgi:hypothetical protein
MKSKVNYRNTIIIIIIIIIIIAKAAVFPQDLDFEHLMMAI